MKKVELFNDHFQNEVWKNIPEYEDYQVSNYGRVKSSNRIIKQYGHKGFYERVMRGKILKPRTQNGGYLIVWLSRNGKSIAKTVHRLVAITFIGYIKGMDINHKDGNKQNNKLENLEWVTRSENIKHDYHILGHIHNSCKVRCIETGEVFASIKQASIKYNINYGSIINALSGRTKKAGNKSWQRM